MHSRRLACLFLGIWLGASLLMAWVATENFRNVDRLLAKPSPAAILSIKPLGPAAARLLLRYQVSEQNRRLFQAWGTIQLIAGAGFFLFLLFGTREGKYPLMLVVLMLCVVILQLFALVPSMVAVGRLIDFAPPDQLTGERSRFWVLHTMYVITEVFKWGLGLFLGLRLARRRGRSGNTGQNLDPIDKANHRHVNR
ncbi:MAG TPA: hypothetical protein VLY24_24025 [Bryobacteraceae bacterium]|nr:hypothetical protein [Bryobacteraceae bacterium]